jgi:glyoxylase I family protein
MTRWPRVNLHLILSGTGTSGARDIPNGRKQEPGGWNRIVLWVDDLQACIVKLKEVGAHFRNQIEVGPGGSQILLEDPDGNPIELHEASKG